MGEPSDEHLRRLDLRTPAEEESTEPRALPKPPAGVSRVDTLPEGFDKLLSRRPHFIGDVIANRYKLVETLGDGAMGQVFVAENLAIGRRVAIKVLKAELLADSSFRTRFQREAEAIAAIDHRNVVRFLDLVVGDPTFLVMEYVPGPTLADTLKDGAKLDPVRAINITKRLCWGLDSVHRAGVIHRDIKPSNVILSPDAELGEEPKIIDFGLAKQVMASAQEQVTRTGQIVGTPHYMSPEQIANREIDARSDVYALGCLLYHMVAGRPPFDGADDVQVLFQQVQRAPDPLAQYAPDAPPELDTVLKRALAKAPEARFATMRELVRALSQIERRKHPEEGRRRGRVNRALAAALIATALAVGGAGGWLAGGARDRGMLLVVSSHPSGAEVEIDGVRVAEPTPTALRGLKPGRHQVRVLSEGRAPMEQLVTLEPKQRTVVDVALQPKSHSVEVNTFPAGSLVYVDGHLQSGQTPLRVEVVDDDFHELRFEKSGYASGVRALKPEDHDAVINVELQQEKEPRGLLWVDSNRSAHVFVDGQDTGVETPTLGLIVSTGMHTIELRDEAGVRLATGRVKVAQGDSRHMALDTCPPPAKP